MTSEVLIVAVTIIKLFVLISLIFCCHLLTLIPPHCLWVFDPQTRNTFLHIFLGNNEVMSEIATFLTKT